MSAKVEATKEVTKAVQEVAKATGNAIDACREAGKFFAPYLSAPIEIAAGIVADRLQFVRFSQAVKLRDRAQALWERRGMKGPSRQVPLTIGVPLLQAATLEEDDGLHQLWARLLVNAGDASREPIPRSFVSILEELASLDAACLVTLAKAAAAADHKYAGLATAGLPETVEVLVDGQHSTPPSRHLQIALGNLRRLGLIDFATGWGGDLPGDVAVTPLGWAFYLACTEE